MGQNMQMHHSLRCKQIDMSTADQLTQRASGVFEFHLTLRNTIINIGHLDQIRYVLTVPFNEDAMANNEICNNQPMKKHHNQITLTQNTLLTR